MTNVKKKKKKKKNTKIKKNIYIQKEKEKKVEENMLAFFTCKYLSNVCNGTRADEKNIYMNKKNKNTQCITMKNE